MGALGVTSLCEDFLLPFIKCVRFKYVSGDKIWCTWIKCSFLLTQTHIVTFTFKHINVIFCGVTQDKCFELFIIFASYSYKKFCAYGQSKLANILHANELARRLKVC